MDFSLERRGRVFSQEKKEKTGAFSAREVFLLIGVRQSFFSFTMRKKEATLSIQEEGNQPPGEKQCISTLPEGRKSMAF